MSCFRWLTNGGSRSTLSWTMPAEMGYAESNLKRLGPPPFTNIFFFTGPCVYTVCICIYIYIERESCVYIISMFIHLLWHMLLHCVISILLYFIVFEFDLHIFTIICIYNWNINPQEGLGFFRPRVPMKVNHKCPRTGRVAPTVAITLGRRSWDWIDPIRGETEVLQQPDAGSYTRNLLLLFHALVYHGCSCQVYIGTHTL